MAVEPDIASQSADLDRKQRALALLDQLLDLDAPARAVRLRALRTDEPELVTAVARLLAADVSRDGRLDYDAAALLAAATEQEHDPFLGRYIGPWHLAELIGRGGMGAVYRAERASGEFDQTCALKLIRLGLDQPSAREHFLRERQILARLRHPHIAILLDGGISEQLPWFAMELIEGEPIDRWCDARRATTRERVRLFQQVLDAVRYAHGQLIVHRDLKPANILVTHEGQAKLLDFGVAKLIETDDGDRPQTREHALTPEYAAPEQILGQPVSTATDVYSLGLLLYLLLSGVHPFGNASLASGSLAQRLALLDHEPESLARAAAKVTPALAQARRSSPRALARSLRGDLTAIVQRCLEKDPAQRYASADAFSDDLTRWLERRPVAARNGRLAYRLRRFVRRNRWPMAAAASFVVLAVGFAVNQQLQFERMQAERDNTEATLRFFTDTLKQVDPIAAGNPDITLRQVTDLNLKRAELDRSLTPEVRARLLATLGEVYTILGRYDQANKALEMAAKLFGTDRAHKARAVGDLAYSHFVSGDQQYALRYANEALALSQDLPWQPDNALIQARLLWVWAYLHTTVSDLDLKFILFQVQRTQALIEEQHLPDSVEYAEALGYFGQIYLYVLHPDEAGALLQRSIDIYRRENMLETRGGRQVRAWRAQSLLASGDFNGARPEYIALIDLWTRLSGPDGQELGQWKIDYSALLDYSGHTAESIAPTEDAIRIFILHEGEDSAQVQRLRVTLAERLQRMKQNERAESIAAAVRDRLQGRDDPRARMAYARTLAVLANGRLLGGDHDGAQKLIEEGRKTIADLDPMQPKVGEAKQRLTDTQANICLLAGDYLCAERNAKEAIEITQRIPYLVRDRLLAQRTLALALLSVPGQQVEGQTLLGQARATALSDYGACNVVSLAMERTAPLTTLAALQAEPTPRCPKVIY